MNGHARAGHWAAQRARRRSGKLHVAMQHCANADCPGLARDGVPGEFRDEAESCPDCGLPLAAGRRPEASDAEYRDWVTVYCARNSVVAHLFRGALEAEGIQVTLRGEALGGAVGELPATVLQVEVQVPAADAERARELALAVEADIAKSPEAEAS